MSHSSRDPIHFMSSAALPYTPSTDPVRSVVPPAPTLYNSHLLSSDVSKDTSDITPPIPDEKYQQFRKYIAQREISKAVDYVFGIFFNGEYDSATFCFFDLAYNWGFDLPKNFHSTRDDFSLCHFVAQLMAAPPGHAGRSIRLKFVLDLLRKQLLTFRHAADDFSQQKYQETIENNLREMCYWIENELELPDAKRKQEKKDNYSNLKKLPAEIIFQTLIAFNYLSKAHNPRDHEKELKLSLDFLKIPLEQKCSEAQFVHHLVQGVSKNADLDKTTLNRLGDEGLAAAKRLLAGGSFFVGTMRVELKKNTNPSLTPVITNDVKAVDPSCANAELKLSGAKSIVVINQTQTAAPSSLTVTTEMTPFAIASGYFFDGKYDEAEKNFSVLRETQPTNGIYLLGYLLSLLLQNTPSKNNTKNVLKIITEFLKQYSIEDCAEYPEIQQACYWLEKEANNGNAGKRRGQYEKFSRYGCYSNVKNVSAVMMMRFLMASCLMNYCYEEDLAQDKVAHFMARWMLTIAATPDNFPEAACLMSEAFQGYDYGAFQSQFKIGIPQTIMAAWSQLFVDQIIAPLRPPVLLFHEKADKQKVPYAVLKSADYVVPQSVKPKDEQKYEKKAKSQRENFLRQAIKNQVPYAYYRLFLHFKNDQQYGLAIQTLEDGKKAGSRECRFELAFHHVQKSKCNPKVAMEELYASAMQAHPPAMAYLGLLLLLRESKEEFEKKDDYALRMKKYPSLELHVVGFNVSLLVVLLNNPSAQRFLDQLEKPKADSQYAAKLITVAGKSPGVVLTKDLLNDCIRFKEHYLKASEEAKKSAIVEIVAAKQDMKALETKITTTQTIVTTLEQKLAEAEKALAVATAEETQEAKKVIKVKPKPKSDVSAESKSFDTQSIVVISEKDWLLECKNLASRGNQKAQEKLADFYTDTHYDAKESVTWTKILAEKGNIVAQCRMGFFYWLGKGVPQDYKAAVKWYKKVVRNKNVIFESTTAFNNLGIAYAEGKGVKENLAQAIKYFNESIKLGDPYGHYSIYFYTKAQDFQGAYQHLIKAVGQRRACPPAINEVWRCNQELIAKGDPRGYYFCGYICQTGWGNLFSIDHQIALQYYQRAKELGYIHDSLDIGEGPDKAIAALTLRR